MDRPRDDNRKMRVVRIDMSRLLLWAVSFMVLALAGSNARAAELCGSSHNSVREALETVSAGNGIKQVRNDQDYLELKDERRGVIWAFTKPQHFAHPAVFCRRVIQADGKFHLEVNTLCSASKAVCDRFAAALAAESKRVVGEK
jgi:hypothetical protein